MNKKQVIKTLEYHLYESNKNAQWYTSMLFTIESIYGKDSSQMALFSIYQFPDAINIYPNLIETLISNIKMNGMPLLHNTQGKNFLKNVDNKLLWSIFSVLVPGLFIFGYKVSEYRNELSTSKVNTEIQLKRDSISFLITRIKNSQDKSPKSKKASGNGK